MGGKCDVKCNGKKQSGILSFSMKQLLFFPFPLRHATVDTRDGLMRIWGRGRLAGKNIE